MAVSIKDVEHVARLARLGLTPEEKKLFAGQLSHILEYAQAINALPTEKVEPMSHAIPLKNVFREDEVNTWKDPQSIIDSAPTKEEQMFRVPRILE